MVIMITDSDEIQEKKLREFVEKLEKIRGRHTELVTVSKLIASIKNIRRV